MVCDEGMFVRGSVVLCRREVVKYEMNIIEK